MVGGLVGGNLTVDMDLGLMLTWLRRLSGAFSVRVSVIPTGLVREK